MTTQADFNSIQSVQMYPDEVEYMIDVIKNMPENGLFVEWGSGGSTCMWLNNLKPTQSLVSIEHNIEWFNKVNQAIKESFPPEVHSRFTYIYEPERGGYKHTYACVEEENPFGLWRYMLPNEEILDGDVFFVDGIARGATVALILLKRTNPDSLVFIHDYTGRESAYSWISQICDVETVGQTLVKLTFKK